jgi:hypothetical protein
MDNVTGTDLVQHETDQQLDKIAKGTDLDRVARLGLWLAAAESNSNDPKAKGMAAALRIGYAESLGLPAHAAGEIHIIKGNLTLSAKMCRALAHQHGLRVIRKQATDDSCTAAVVDSDGNELGEATYTLAQAKREGRSGDNWTKYPDRMMWARASKRALDDFAPWVTLGVIVAEDALEGEVVPDPFEDGD